MPTLKQKKAIKELVENGGTSVSQAMRNAGYSDATAKTPQKLTESDGWRELMAKHLPDDLLATVHEEGLKATFTDKFNTAAPDFSTRQKYLDTAYKLKGSYAPDKTLNLNVDLTIDNQAIDQLAQMLEVHERTNQPGDGSTTHAVDKEVSS